MLHRLSHMLVVIFCLFLAIAQAAGQDFRQFFRKPETALEFWAAVHSEIQVGKYELAASHFKGFLAKMPTDEELLQLEEKEGMSSFLRLLSIPDLWTVSDQSLKELQAGEPEDQVPAETVAKLERMLGKIYYKRKDYVDELAKTLSEKELDRYREKLLKAGFVSMRTDAGPLIERVSEVVRKFRTDPVRIKKFVKNLSQTPEERAYAIAELRRAGPVAIPHLVETLLSNPDSQIHAKILSAMLRLNRDVVPPLLAALDANEPTVRAELIDVLRQRGDPRAVPYLWYISDSPKQPDFVRKQAKAALALLLNSDPDKLPSAKAALTREADRYYLHKVKFQDPGAVVVWQWDGMQIVLPPPSYTASQAEEFYGLRFARQALDLDPGYKPAQIVFLSLALEKAYERVGIDQPLEKGAPEVRDLLRSVNPDLLTATLERALTDRHLPVILGTVRALGDLTEIRASRIGSNHTPALVRALSYPDRRVQLAAAESLLRLPGSALPPSSARVVEVLRRALLTGPSSRALIADPNVDRANELGKAVKEAGFEPVIVHTGRDVQHRLAEAADIDVLLVHPALPDSDLTHLLPQLRADINQGNLPVLITVPPEREALEQRGQSLQHLLSTYRNVWLVSEVPNPTTLKSAIASSVMQSMGKPLSEEERKAHVATALGWLRSIAVGETPGYDARPAQNAILQALRIEELRPPALIALGGLPGQVAQRQLATVVLNPDERPETRSLAAIVLNRHIQQHGMLLTREQTQAIQEVFQTSTDAELKGNIARVVGSLRPNAVRTGNRLQGYAPAPPPPAVPPPPAADKDKPPADKDKPPADKDAPPVDKDKPPADKDKPPADKDKDAPPGDKDKKKDE